MVQSSYRCTLEDRCAFFALSKASIEDALAAEAPGGAGQTRRCHPGDLLTAAAARHRPSPAKGR